MSGCATGVAGTGRAGHTFSAGTCLTGCTIAIRGTGGGSIDRKHDLFRFCVLVSIIILASDINRISSVAKRGGKSIFVNLAAGHRKGIGHLVIILVGEAEPASGIFVGISRYLRSIIRNRVFG